MFRQYYAQRCRGGRNPLRVGVIPIGAIFYIQDEAWWRDRFRGPPICRNPWVVESFLNGTMGAGRRNPETGFWETTYRSGRSDMAIIRSLRDGRSRWIAVRVLERHEDEGLTKGTNVYPSLPAMHRYRRARAGLDQETSAALFAGVFPGGIVYADRRRTKHGDYARCAFLPFTTLELTIEPDCPADLRPVIVSDAASVQARRGQDLPVSTAGQTVRLGTTL